MTGVLKGKVALVTGAGGGIGLAAATAFAEAGASVVLADRNEQLISRSTERIRLAGHNATGVTCDVMDKAQVTKDGRASRHHLRSAGRRIQQCRYQQRAAQGIRINAVCPGMVNTPMAVAVTKNYDPDTVEAMVARAPIGRFGEAEEIAAAVVWLCTPAASFLIGHAMAVDGGFLAQ
jgi:NAD(P)-dependent dehydrogenase (short-subunit alcohol dehydrogenase family)